MRQLLAAVEARLHELARRAFFAQPIAGEVRIIAYVKLLPASRKRALRKFSVVEDLNYLQRRAAQERAAALRATHPRARQAHLVLAHEYERLIGRVGSNERKLETYPPVADFHPAGSEKEKVHGDTRE